MEVQQEIDRGDRVIVGVNKYESNESSASIGFFRHRDDTTKRALENIIRLRNKRDNHKTKEALSDLRETLINGGNTMRPMIEAAKAFATLGEIMGVCREVIGEYTPNV